MNNEYPIKKKKKNREIYFSTDNYSEFLYQSEKNKKSMNPK